MKSIILFFITIIIIFEVPAQDYVKYADPWMGVIGKGNCVLGPQLPFGSVNPSPDTPEGRTDGYNINEKIRGFSQLHLTGAGGPGKYGQFLISPQIGLNVLKEGHDSNKAEEEAYINYYKVRLTDYNILCEFSPSENAVLYNFNFPKSDSSFVLIDLAHTIPGDITHRGKGINRGGYAEQGAVTIDITGRKIIGWGSYWGGWSAEPFKVHFVLEFNKPFHTYGTCKDGVVNFERRDEMVETKAQRIGAFVGFNTDDGELIQAKIAVSFKSIANASVFLTREIPGWNMDWVKKEAAEKWNNRLGRIDLKGVEGEKMKMFYSSLYQAMRMPRNRTKDNPHWESELPYWDDHNCIWDTWKTVFPLHTLINEQVVRDNVLAFIDRYKHNGQVYDAFLAGNDRVYQWTEVELPYYFHNQGGDNVDNVIADAFIKKVKGIDWQKAYEVVKFQAEKMRTNAYLINDRGWIPFRTYEYAFDGSRTMEFAYNDFCVAQMAKGLNKKADYKRYLNRSKKWVALWNDTLKSFGYQGFINPKNQNGNWLKYTPTEDFIVNSPGKFDRSFYEGSSWVYSYNVPHEMEKLINLMGGEDKYVERLQFAMKNNLIEMENEPSFLIPYSFIYAGRPDLTAYWVKDNCKKYSPEGFPGDEDSGAMGSWYVFANLGLFPVAGQDIYLISGPLCPSVTLTRENGKKLIIEAENISDENIYVQSATLNNQPLNRAWLRHAEIENGATLKFVMGSTPSDWARNDPPR
ncbi:MAG: GH92 family glycosyl hydrolase [Chitinophagaceae bacterium]|nr:GH92 family glycosyl hydrolase [Chitinophagaceae bacterium]